ncbi:hypothetical protein V2J09_015430 [Rumex salicifolius]
MLTQIRGCGKQTVGEKEGVRQPSADASSHVLFKVMVDMVKHSPSPSLSCTHVLPSAVQVSHVPGADSRYNSSSSLLNDLHIPAQLMENFRDLARENTDKDMETCGVLGAYLKGGVLYAVTLVIPKQESTSSSCQASSEEEIFTVLNERSLLPVGWIHTHPSQSCFMSSIDLHTQYSYQVMVPEAIAIVVAPTDKSRSDGIFRISDPSGMAILKDCQESGFHPHEEPSDGSSIYELCSHIYINPNLRFEIFDLRR